MTIAGGLSLAALPDAAQAEWLEATSPHFTVIGDMSEADLRMRTQRLEQYDAMLRKVLGVTDAPPVTIFVVGDIGDVQAAMGRSSGSVAGFYSASAQRAFAVVPERVSNVPNGFNPRVVLHHEYAHHMLLSNVSVFMPGWAQEGLAEMFSTAKMDSDGSVTVGAPDIARSRELFGTHRWSVRRLLQSDFSPPKGDEVIEKYSRGWVMAHYLWLSGQRSGQYAAFIAELNKSFEPEESGQKVFGDLNILDRELNTYLARGSFKTSRFDAVMLNAPREVQIRPLTAGERAIIPYRLASTVGVSREDAGPLADRARPVALRFPDDVSVQVALAEIEYDARNDVAAEAAADRVLGIDPNNLLGLAYKGRVVMRRAIAAKDPQLAKTGRSWLLKANRAHPEHALPYQLFYDSFAPMGDAPTANAANGLYKAVHLVPQDISLRIRAAVQLIRDGKLDDARLILAPAAFAAESAGESKFLKLIREMTPGATRETLLAKVSELKLDRINELFDPPKGEEEDEDEG